MADLQTRYMGLTLKSPIIVGASALTSDMKSLGQIEQAGAGAVVIKSLFEEQVMMDALRFDDEAHRNDIQNPEMATTMPNVMHAGPQQHLLWVRKAKETLRIPVIGSLNAINLETWLDYAKRLEDTGVDGLECNLYASPRDAGRSGAGVEAEQVDLVRRLKETVRLPLSVKLSPYYANPLNVIRQFDEAGVAAVVTFNRLFEPDIDVAAERAISPFNLSQGTDYRLPLRYAGLLEGTIRADICASTGIATGEHVVKMLLAGAHAVQVVSVLYQNGVSHVGKMAQELGQWMDGKGYRTLADFRGKLSRRHVGDPWVYTRGQYIRALMSSARDLARLVVR